MKIKYYYCLFERNSLFLVQNVSPRECANFSKVHKKIRSGGQSYNRLNHSFTGEMCKNKLVKSVQNRQCYNNRTFGECAHCAPHCECESGFRNCDSKLGLLSSFGCVPGFGVLPGYVFFLSFFCNIINSFPLFLFTSFVAKMETLVVKATTTFSIAMRLSIVSCSSYIYVCWKSKWINLLCCFERDVV